MFDGELNIEPNTFHQDFSIADVFGHNAIRDTYNRALEWKTDVKMFTALVAILNVKCWEHYHRGNEATSKLYAELYYKAYNLGCRTFKGADFKYFWTTLD